MTLRGMEFECLGITEKSVGGKEEEEVIKLLKKNARRFYQKYKRKLRFNRDYKFQIRKRMPFNFGREQTMCWYYVNYESSEGSSEDGGFLDKGSHRF